MTHAHRGLDPDERDGIVATERRLRTVGIDVGTTTSHLIFSELVLERQGIRLSSTYEVVERSVVSRSDVILVPARSVVPVVVKSLVFAHR